MSLLSTLDKSRGAFPPPEVQGNHSCDVYAEPDGILNEMHEGKPRQLVMLAVVEKRSVSETTETFFREYLDRFKDFVKAIEKGKQKL
jgi:hypothetical protein